MLMKAQIGLKGSPETILQRMFCVVLSTFYSVTLLGCFWSFIVVIHVGDVSA